MTFLARWVLTAAVLFLSLYLKTYGLAVVWNFFLWALLGPAVIAAVIAILSFQIFPHSNVPHDQDWPPDDYRRCGEG